MMPSPLQANGGYTLRVAASNSSAQNKQEADYLCTGTNDEVPIQEAVNALPATGGKVILEAGTYMLGAGVVIASDAVILEGEGNGTLIQFSGANNAACLSNGSSTIRHYFMQVKNLFLQDTDGNGTGIDCSYWSLALVSNVRIYGVKIGINGNGQGQGTCLYNYFENVTIHPAIVPENVGLQLTNTANENTCMRIRIVANAQTTGLINAAHGNSFYDYDVEGAAVGIDVQTGGDDCSIFAPYLEDNKINFQIAANVEACSLFGGTNAYGPNTTSSINNLGAKGLNIYNLRLNYEQFTHSEVQNGFPKNRWLVPYFGNGMIACTCATPIAGTAYLEEFEVPEDSFLEGISYVKGATQAGNVTVGVYGPIATEETCDGAPLLVQSASTAVSAGPNIDQFVSFPKTLAHAGRYYAAIEFSDETNTFQRYPNMNVVTGWSQMYVVDGGYGAFTDPCPSPTNTGTNMPSLKIRCASLTIV